MRVFGLLFCFSQLVIAYKTSFHLHQRHEKIYSQPYTYREPVPSHVLPIKKPWNRISKRRYQHPSSWERRHTMDNLLNEIDNSEILSKDRYISSLPEINQAILTAGRLNRPNDALKLFQSIATFGLRADLVSYNNMIWSFSHATRIKEAQQQFKELLSHPSLTPNEYTYSSLMYGLARARRHQEALQYLEEMQHHGVTPNSYIYASVMDACVGAGRYHEALDLMKRAESNSIYPDVTMVNIALKALAQLGDMEGAENLANSLRSEQSLDIRSFHTLMMGHSKQLQYWRVLQLYEEACAANIELDNGIYTLAMLSALNNKQYASVVRIAQQARDTRAGLCEASYSVLIKALGKTDQPFAAVECLNSMRSEGIQPNAVTYTTLFTACRQQPRLVCHLLAHAKDDLVELNTISLTAAINVLGFGELDCIDKAVQLFEQMENKGPEPSLLTYNTIIRILAENGRAEEALGKLENIEKRGIKPNCGTFTSLLNPPRESAETSVLHHINLVDNVMNKMRQLNVTPNESVYGAVLEVCRRAGDSVRAVEYLNHMREHKLQPSANHFYLILCALRSQGHIDKMFKMVTSTTTSLHRSSGSSTLFNQNSYELVIGSLLEQKRWKESLAVVTAMDKSGGLTPALSTCAALVELLIEAKEFTAAFALFTYLERKGCDVYEDCALCEAFNHLHVLISNIK